MKCAKSLALRGMALPHSKLELQYAAHLTRHALSEMKG